MIDFVKSHKRFRIKMERILNPLRKLLSIIPGAKNLLKKLHQIDEKYYDFVEEKVYIKLNNLIPIFSTSWIKIKKYCSINIDTPYILPNNEQNLGLLMYAKKSAIKWRRIAFIVIFTTTIYVICGKSTNDKSPDYTSMSGYIANITISGPIMGNEEIYKSLKKIRDNDSIRAVILNIDSPGGSVFPSEMMYFILRQIDEKKPVVTVMGSVAASGGYLTAIAGRYIFAMPSTVTGSIGVFMSAVDIVDLANKMGIKMNYIKTSDIKGSPHPFEHLSPEVAKKIKEVINDIFVSFKNAVQIRRKFNNETMKMIANGQVFVGTRALKYGLIDSIGTEESAKLWLYENKLVPNGMKVRDIDIDSKENEKKYGILGRSVSIITENISNVILQVIKNELSSNKIDVSL